MASPYAAAVQQGILGLPNNNIGLLGASLKDAMAYFTGHPEGATALLPAIQEAQQSGYMRSLLDPNQRLAPQQPIPNAAPAAQPQATQPPPTNIQAMFDQKGAPTFDQMNAGITNPNGAAPQPPQPAPVAMGMQPLPRMQQGQQMAQLQPQSQQPPVPTGADVPQAQKPSDYGDLNERAQAVYDQIPHIPGMPARQALTFYLTDPAAYQTAAVKQYDLTDMQKNTSAAYGSGTPQANAIMRGTLAKGAAVNLRSGGGALNYADGSIITMPGQNGVQTLFPQGMNGPAMQQMAPGGAQALAASAYSQNAGKAATTPDIGYDSTGNPVATNNLAMTGAGNPLGLPGQPGTAPLPTMGARGLPRIGQTAPQGGPLLPALPANQQPYMAGMGKEAADRHSANVQAAEGSPDRVNVLDNIINLSGSGVATGPGQDFQNKVLGYAANAPGLSIIMGGAKDNVSKFQELQKFLQQNGQRAWQAAGGTGTDAQLEAASHANPNDAQFPQALQTVAKWVKAGELAVQAKANAQDRYLQQNGSTAPNQNAFENQWRNAMDRRVFQLQAASPQEQQQMIKSFTPQQAQIVRQKRQALMGLGAIQ